MYHTTDKGENISFLNTLLIFLNLLICEWNSWS